MNSDASVGAYKGTHPIVEEMERARALDELECVDIVYIMHESRPQTVIEATRPEFYAKGHDWPYDTLPERNLLEIIGATYLHDQTTQDLVTTSELKERVKHNATKQS
jgi:bifunctional ADP-heptose synthase (sugar kinase/adenylyltransferase)